MRPYISYVNNLYIYPESLNLNVGFAKKNIVIQITLLDNDQNVEEPHGIQVGFLISYLSFQLIFFKFLGNLCKERWTIIPLHYLYFCGLSSKETHFL